MHSLIVSASVSSFFFGLFGVNWEAIDERIAREFPQVEFIAAEQLLQQYRGGELPVIVDVREAEEFEVSHLEQALNLETGDAVAAAIPDRSTAIVVYCSVGYRSAAVAARLQQLGYGNVLNLRHAIFEWASRDYPLHNEAGDTDKVHPFNRVWGSLVDESLHQYP